MKQILIKLFAFIMVVVFSMMLVSCVVKPKEPYMLDRSKGWMPSFPEYVTNDPENIVDENLNELNWDADISFIWDELRDYSGLEELGAIGAEDVLDSARKALTWVYGDGYDVTDEAFIVNENTVGNAWICFGENTCVMFEKRTGRIWLCIDDEQQPEFQINKNFRLIDCRVDLAKLSEAELSSLQLKIGITSLKVPRRTAQELPLDAVSAYGITEEMIRNGVFDSQRYGVLQAVGGEICVYYCEASDAWFVVSGVSTQAFSRSTGKQLLLLDDSTDESVKEKEE